MGLRDSGSLGLRDSGTLALSGRGCVHFVHLFAHAHAVFFACIGVSGIKYMDPEVHI